MPSAERAVDRGTRLARRDVQDIGDEFRERRVQLGESQHHVAESCQVSRAHYGRIEKGSIAKLTLIDLHRISAVLGLSPSIRLYPSGAPVRDAGHATRLQRFIAPAAAPLKVRLEVPLPMVEDRPEQRAWDAVFLGGGQRTAIELEMRLRDVQAVIRRIDLKRRDDRTEWFLLLIADTRTNRRVLAEFAGLFADWPRLKPTAVRHALEAGVHPGTGIVLV